MIRVVKGGTLVDGTGKEPLDKAVVVIDGSNIVGVGREGQVDIPSALGWCKIAAVSKILPRFRPTADAERTGS